MLKNSVDVSLRQTLKITQKTIQAIELLQMNTLEIIDYLNNKIEENPTIEPLVISRDLYQLQDIQTKERRPTVKQVSSGFPASAMDIWDYLPSNKVEDIVEDIKAFLNDQLERKKLPNNKLYLCKYLIEMLDSNGYLLEEDVSYMESLSIPKSLIIEAIQILQSLDPPGIAAKDLSECLKIQLQRLNGPHEIAISVVENYLEAASKKRFSYIAKKLKTDENSVRKAFEEIRALNAKPTANFSSSGTVSEYVCPDVFAVVENGHVQMVLNDFCCPKIEISKYYKDLVQNTEQEDVKVYLQKKIDQAEWLQNCIERRKITLQKCVDCIAQIQADFLLGKRDTLVPMSLEDISMRINVDISTVSRAAKDKYLQTKDQTFPLHFLFSRSVRTNKSRPVSMHYVKSKIDKLIKSENPQDPLSDQRITELLQSEGICIARRTVTKYRLSLNIEGVAARKNTF